MFRMLLSSMNLTESHPQCLFTSDGCLWSDERLRKVFSKICTRNGLSIGIQDYRQAVTAILRRDGMQKMNAVLQTFFHEQAGHAAETAELEYGTTNKDTMTIGPDTLLNFFKISQCWHSLIGLSSNERAPIESKESFSYPSSHLNRITDVVVKRLEPTFSKVELFLKNQLTISHELQALQAALTASSPGQKPLSFSYRYLNHLPTWSKQHCFLD